jgi:hypothetical protein
LRADRWALPLYRGERFEFTEPTPEGIEHIATNLRAADAVELRAASGSGGMLALLRMSVLASDSTVMAVNPYGVPVALLGVNAVSLIYNSGGPWMVGTDDLDRYRRALIACGRTYTAAMLQRYARLENHVDARNKKTVAWLQHIGFTLSPAAPFGPAGVPFHLFWIER